MDVRSARIVVVLVVVGILGLADRTSGQSSTPAQPFDQGFTQGEAAANEQPTDWGWFARGLVGGLVGGPIGTGVAFTMAGRSEVVLPADAPSGRGAFDEGYAQGYRDQLLFRRKEKAFVGGLVGTVVWGWAVLRVIDLAGGGSVTGDPGNGETVNRVPIGISIPVP